MSTYLRRLVSGNKARFKDDELDLELDLAYVTDQIIVMGFPAVGVESIYRNHRADVQRFLSARHGSDFWVFNFCPLTENAYPESVFQGRVSRYPFPDHHVPPFPFLSLVTMEIHAWLAGSRARVAVLHCKAGKGRSGTLACAYLLSLYISPSSSIPGSLAEQRMEGLQTPSSGAEETPKSQFDDDVGKTRSSTSSAHPNAALARVASEPLMNRLEQVLDLHRSRRMKSSSKPSRHSHRTSLGRKPKMGVSIPSQQRWLFYWSEILQGNGPASFRLFSGMDPPDGHETPLNKPNEIGKVWLTKLTIRMQGLSGVQPLIVQAASAVITRTGKGRGAGSSTAGKVWASLARYNDSFVDELERTERSSRSPTASKGQAVSNLFRNDEWDKEKMVHSFAQMGVNDPEPIQEEDTTGEVLTYVLSPLSWNELEGDWVELHEEMGRSQCEEVQHTSTLERSAYAFVSRPVGDDNPRPEEPGGILLAANREFRIKLFIGGVVLGWVWLIPAFHMSLDSPTSTVVLTHDDIDFAIGIGKALVDMKVTFVSCN
ncbi:hypothetical protein BU15DRAFT_88079 [Melanogaster broomeanus]|nr:hypothetical protein BU15DRAFT_88079 [Melanogaster broomeanus]